MSNKPKKKKSNLGGKIMVWIMIIAMVASFVGMILFYAFSI